jgi:hypothetical protein
MEKQIFSENRRDFITKVVPLAALFCFGCKGAAAQKMTAESFSKPLESLGLSTEETYNFFYGIFIPLMQSLEKEMGSEKFIDLITKTSTENLATMVEDMTKDLKERDLISFADFLKDILAAPPYNTAFTYEITEQSDKVLELTYTQCVPAKLLCAMNAANIGLAIECSGAQAAAKAINPKIKYSNPKNIMKGDSYCIERFTLDT